MWMTGAGETIWQRFNIIKELLLGAADLAAYADEISHNYDHKGHHQLKYQDPGC